MTAYRVTAERTGKWWVLQAVDVPGAISQVARLDQADQIVEAIAFVTKLPEAEIEIVVDPVLPSSISDRMERVRQLREESDRVRSQAATEWRSLAKSLAAEGFSVRDIGTVLHVSPQRAQQLVAS